MLEKTLESLSDCKEIKLANPQGTQSWIFIGRTDAEAETPKLWPPDAKNWLTGKDPDAGKNWGPEETGVIEDEMVGWHHWLNGHEFKQTQGDSDGQKNLACFSSWGHTWLSNWTTTNSSTQAKLLRSPCHTLTFRSHNVRKKKYRWFQHIWIIL